MILLIHSWEQRLAIRYYNRLFKEYALVDLSYYQINKIGMRWRTEKEVIEGKGQFACGNIHCDNSNIHDLCSYEVPFSYRNLSGEKVTALVKVRVCGPCAYYLNLIISLVLNYIIRRSKSMSIFIQKQGNVARNAHHLKTYSPIWLMSLVIMRMK